MVALGVLFVFILGIITGSGFTVILLYCVSRQHIFGALKINSDNPSDEFLTVELHKELTALNNETEIILKVERS